LKLGSDQRAPSKSQTCNICGITVASAFSLPFHKKKCVQKKFEKETDKLLGHISLRQSDKMDIAARLSELQESLQATGIGQHHAEQMDPDAFPNIERYHSAAADHIKRMRQEDSHGPRDKQVLRLVNSLSSSPYMTSQAHKFSGDRRVSSHSQAQSSVPSGMTPSPPQNKHLDTIASGINGSQGDIMPKADFNNANVNLSMLLPSEKERTRLGALAIRETHRKDSKWKIREIDFCYSLQLSAEGNSVDFSPKGHTLLCGHELGLTCFTDDHNLSNGNQHSSTISQIRTGCAFGAKYSPEGLMIASGMFGDNLVHLWRAVDVTDGVNGMEEVTDDPGYGLRQTLGHSDWIRDVSWSCAQTHLVSGGNDKKVKVWDLEKHAPITNFKHQREVFAVGWQTSDQPERGRIAAGDRAGIAWLYDIRSPPNPESNIKLEQPGIVTAVEWSPDGRFIAVANDSQGPCVRLYDPRLLTSGSRQAWVSAFGSHQRCSSIAWDPQGRIIMTGGMEGLVKLWDTYGSRCLAELPGHTNRVRSVAWSSNGSSIASVSDDTTVRIWNIS